LRGYGGKNPKQEYKRESFQLFESLLNNIQMEVIKFLSLVRIRKEEEVDSIEKQRVAEASGTVQQSVHNSGTALPPGESAGQSPGQTVTRGAPKVGRNEPCPCGSGLKYKQCHGKLN